MAPTLLFVSHTSTCGAPQAYHGCTAEMDAMMGQIMDALALSKAANETLTLFTADHGELHLEHRLVEKMSMFEGSARVPLIMAGPGVPEGSVVTNITR